LLRQHGRSADQAELVTRLSGGRLGAALALELAPTLECRAEVLQCLRQAQTGDPAVVLSSAEQWAKRKSDYPILFEMLLSLLRDLVITRAGGDDALLMHSDIRDALAPLAAVPSATLWEIFEVVHSTQEAVAHNANPQLALEVMLLKIGDAYERARQRGRQQHYASL
jgi:DNA polymerase III gamma/tau subunit